jgi:hypothetical protein
LSGVVWPLPDLGKWGKWGVHILTEDSVRNPVRDSRDKLGAFCYLLTVLRLQLKLVLFLLAITGGTASAFSRHAANSGTESFTWTAAGRALTKTNARGTVIGYGYDAVTGEM